jgi:hypothetical protein
MKKALIISGAAIVSIILLPVAHSGGYPREEMPGALNLLVHRPLNPPMQRTINAVLMSFGSYPFIVKGFYSFFYHDPTPFARDTALVREACDINRTPNAWDAMYWMQRGLNFDFALPDVNHAITSFLDTIRW